MNNKSEILKRIVNHLIINCSFVKDIGLFHGQFGIIIFFFYYYRYTGNNLYKRIAEELLDEVCSKIPENLSISFENGLCGIGWGILHLLKEEFVEGDPVDILSEIDEKIAQLNIAQMADKSINSGIEGVSYYLIERVNAPSREATTFDTLYLKETQRLIEIFSPYSLKKLLSSNSFSINSPISDWDFGLSKGCSGYALNLLLR